MADKKAPIDTTTEGENLIFLAQGLAGANPGDLIMRQEAQGQRSFVTSDTLPVRCNTNFRGEVSGRQMLEAAGVIFGEIVADDPIFQYVQLPAGWRKAPADHSMWSYLVDDKGRARAARCEAAFARILYLCDDADKALEEVGEVVAAALTSGPDAPKEQRNEPE